MINLNKSYLFALAAGTVLLSSCSREMDFSVPKAEEYANNWKSTFGDIDPNQDWNMAVRTVLNVNLPYIKGDGVLRVYNTNPLEKGSCLMAETKVSNGTGSITFDAMKSMQQVFVSVEVAGEYRVYGYYGIEDGVVNIGLSASNSKIAIGTRAGECNVTKGNVVENVMTAEGEGGEIVSRYNWNGQYLTYEELVQMVIDRGDRWNTSPFENCVKDDGDGNWHFDFTDAKLADWCKPEDVLIGKGENVSISLTYLNGVEKTAANPWKMSWGYENFGPGAFFMEQSKYYLAPKYGTFYSTPEEMAVVEQGFSITTEGGEIELPFIYGATQNQNMLGYVYYKDGQDPLTQPHYIVMNDGRPTENIYFNSWKGDKLNDGMQLSSWNSYDPEQMAIYGHDKDDLVYGTSYKLTFFGENHEMTTGTYDFPAGYHVVFFICSQSLWETGKYNYSLPELNRRIRHYYWVVPGQDTYQEDQTRGNVKAVSWTYKGHRFLGFEDGGNDEDLNDIVFWVEGAYTPDQDKEIKVPTKDPEPEPEAQTWIIACEDLGSTDDFDFNDVVFSVSHVSGQNTAIVTPLAAGGTLGSVVKYDGIAIAPNAEIHNLLQPNVSVGDNGSYPMLTEVAAGDPLTIQVDNSFSMTNHKFSITVEGNGDSHSITMGNETGKAPMMLCLPGTWAWPKERVQIYDAYPMFKDWVKNSNENEWYKYVVNEYVVK